MLGANLLKDLSESEAIRTMWLNTIDAKRALEKITSRYTNKPAPSNFSILENREEVIHYFETVKGMTDTSIATSIDLENIKNIDLPTLCLLSSFMLDTRTGAKYLEVIGPCEQIKYTTVEELEKNIDAELAKYTIIPEFRDMALRILRRNHKSEVKDRTTIYESQQARRKEIQAQLDKLTDQLTRGIVDEDDYVRQRDNLKTQLANLDGTLRNTEKRAEDWLELTEKAFDFATYARIRFNETNDPKVKRDILQTLGADFLLTNNKLALTPKAWLTPIEKDYPSLEKAYLKVRTNEKASPTDIEEAISQIMISWRAI